MRCTAVTQKGQPCKNVALAGSDPARCRVHGAAANPPANREAAPAADDLLARYPSDADLLALVSGEGELLESQLAASRYILALVLVYLRDGRDKLSVSALTRVGGLGLSAVRTFAALLRHRRALSGEAAENFSGLMAQMLDELSTQWGEAEE